MKKLQALMGGFLPLIKHNLKMKISVLILFICISVAQANNTYSQRTKISMNLEHVTVEHVLDYIESNTEFRFLYLLEDVNLNRRVSVVVQDKRVNQILDIVLAGTNTTYSIQDRQVSLYRTKLDEAIPKAETDLAITVTGTITDSSGEILIGATVIEKGTNNGAITDINGGFSVTVASKSSILEASYVGFITTEVVVGDQTNFNIILQADLAQLEEIVVVGYGSQSRQEVTGAVSSLKGKAIAQVVTGNPAAALQGQLAGVQVETFGGQPGGAANVYVRGIGSLTNSFPLYVIDGTFADNMEFINPNDIESIQVLKDASSAAIYGSRASNGVVIIETKKGSGNKDVEVKFTVRRGVERAAKELDFLNSEQFLDYRDDRESNGDTGFQIDRSLFAENGELIFTDWQEESFGTSTIQDYGISVSGGSENSRFFFSTNYYEQDGILVGSGFERINSRINGQFSIGKLTITESLGLTQSKIQENEYFGFEGADVPILRRNAPENLGGFEAPERSEVNFGGLNTFALASLEDNLDTRRNVLGNVNFDMEVLPGLTAKLNLGLEYTNRFKSTFRPTFFMSSTDARFNTNEGNDLTHVRSESVRTQIEPTLSYLKEFDKHKIDALIGYSRIDGRFDLLANYVGNLPSDDIRTTGAAGTDNILGAAGFRETDVLLSTFGRINYVYDGKYLFTGTIRSDATSKFAEGNRSDIFPSFSLGWRVSDESFFPQTSLLSELKIRGGYGELGAQNVGNYLFQSTVGTTSNASFGNAILPGFAQTEFANDGLQWETSATTNVGVDVGLLDNKLAISAEYYRKNIENLLVAVPIPSSNGTNVPVTQNAAALENNGLEFLVTYKGERGAFNYQIGLNLSTQNSRLNDIPTEFFGPSVSEDLTRVNIFRSGEDPGSFYGFIVDGIYNDQAAIDADPNRRNDPNRGLLSPGDFIKRDIDGDGIVDNDDLTILGSPVPDFTYGINLSGSYNKLDFSLFFNGVSGNEIYNQARSFNIFQDDGNKLTEVLDRWTVENPTGSIPRATTNDIAGNSLPSSFFVEDGSFLRLQNLTIGYDLTDFIPLKGLKKVRFSITGQNLFVITNYKGYDPDVASTNGARSNENDGFFGFRPTVNNITGRGIDIRSYPRARSVIAGIEVSF